MAASFPLIMLGIRYALRFHGWVLFLLSGFMIVMLESLVITNQASYHQDSQGDQDPEKSYERSPIYLLRY